MNRRRRGSRLGDVCPRCGAPIRWALFIPTRIDPDKPRRRIPLDMPALADDDPAGEYAASAARTVCRRLRPGDQIDVSEYRHSHHAVSHPQCRDALYPPQRATAQTPARRTA